MAVALSLEVYAMFDSSLSPVLCVMQLWETKKVHTSSAVCLKRDSDVLFNDEEIIVSAADNCNRLQVSQKEKMNFSVRVSSSADKYYCIMMCPYQVVTENNACVSGA